VVLPQGAPHPIGPQRNSIGLIDWWHNDVLGLMYESDKWLAHQRINPATCSAQTTQISMAPTVAATAIQTTAALIVLNIPVVAQPLRPTISKLRCLTMAN
jgi:hypothetical protein